MPGSPEPSPACTLFPAPAEASRHQPKAHCPFPDLEVGKKVTQQVPGPVPAKQSPSGLPAPLPGLGVAGRGQFLNLETPDFQFFPWALVTTKTKKPLQESFSQLHLWWYLTVLCLMVPSGQGWQASQALGC